MHRCPRTWGARGLGKGITVWWELVELAFSLPRCLSLLSLSLTCACTCLFSVIKIPLYIEKNLSPSTFLRYVYQAVCIVSGRIMRQDQNDTLCSVHFPNTHGFAFILPRSFSDPLYKERLCHCRTNARTHVTICVALTATLLNSPWRWNASPTMALRPSRKSHHVAKSSGCVPILILLDIHTIGQGHPAPPILSVLGTHDFTCLSNWSFSCYTWCFSEMTYSLNFGENSQSNYRLNSLQT